LNSPRFSAIHLRRSVKSQQTHLRRGHVAAKILVRSANK